MDLSAIDFFMDYQAREYVLEIKKGFPDTRPIN